MSSLLFTSSNKKTLSMLLMGLGSGAAFYYYIYHHNYTKPSNKKVHGLERKVEGIYDSVSSHMKDAYHTGKKQITDIEKSCEKKVHDWIDRIDHKS
ncbi:hypothetical protein PCANB_002377 [Pneumocystis canis]|nr:hypothetical protein PCK1_002388 [Pneumocystis canis]KAG5439045.1 hypothetical protein PCANB_002377 [Pneumocystis canis]